MFKWSINITVDKFTRNLKIQIKAKLCSWHLKITKTGEGKRHVVGVQLGTTFLEKDVNM